MRTRILSAFYLVLTIAAFGARTGAQTYTFHNLYSFQNDGADPAYPDAAPTLDAAGNIYGTSYFGGVFEQGSVFELSRSGVLTVLHSFGKGADVGNPTASLVRDAAGNLYGTTLFTVFKLAPSGEETFLFTFPHTSYAPEGNNLILDSEGNLYGTATGGGDDGDGTVFKIDTNGNYSVLYQFCAKSGCSDGEYPDAQLLRDPQGNFYGTAFTGGDTSGLCAGTGCGVIFKLTPDGTESLLHTFDRTDGMNPLGLTNDRNGNLYGVTENGIDEGNGTLFRQPSDGAALSTLYRFCSQPQCTDGSSPVGPIIVDKAGTVYGVAAYSTNLAGSVVWKVDRTGKETVLYTFPEGIRTYGLAIDHTGNLYGFTSNGGNNAVGSVFILTVSH